ncbi:unnamed protein product, partial [Didymodactylos carnosus]
KMDAKYALAKIEFKVQPSANNVILTCKGQVENFKEKSASVQLRVFFLPSELTILDNQRLNSLTIDDRPEFICKTTHSNPQSQLRVYRQGNDGRHYLDTTDEIYTQENGGFINSVKFQLPPVNVIYHGNFLTCEASIDVNGEIITKHASYVINVNHKPHFNDYDPFGDVKENQPTHDAPTVTKTHGFSSFDAVTPGTTVTLKCQIDANPMNLSNVRWYKQSIPIVQNGIRFERRFELNEASLIIRSVRKEDAGQYACEIENPFGQNRMDVAL